MARGKFISFEGGEGTGKSTQLKRLADRLRETGIMTITTREPGGTQGAEIIRRTILSGRVKSLGPFAEALLLNAARDDHLNEVIRPALKSGKWVLCDRFADSTRAYQGAISGVDAGMLAAMEASIVGTDGPDLTLTLDLDPEIGLVRARAATMAESGEGTEDRFEDQEIDTHRKLRTAFLEIAENEPDRCVVIDAGKSVDEVAEDIWQAVSSRLPVPQAESDNASATKQTATEPAATAGKTNETA